MRNSLKEDNRRFDMDGSVFRNHFLIKDELKEVYDLGLRDDFFANIDAEFNPQELVTDGNKLSMVLKEIDGTEYDRIQSTFVNSYNKYGNEIFNILKDRKSSVSPHTLLNISIINKYIEVTI